MHCSATAGVGLTMNLLNCSTAGKTMSDGEASQYRVISFACVAVTAFVRLATTGLGLGTLGSPVLSDAYCPQATPASGVIHHRAKLMTSSFFAPAREMTRG